MPALLLAHSASGLGGEGIPSSLLYGLTVAGAAIGAVGLRASERTGAPQAAAGRDGAESDPWPLDDAPPRVRVLVGWPGAELAAGRLVARAAPVRRHRPAPRHPRHDTGTADAGRDWWVPAAILATFAWVLSCWHDGARPRSLAGWLTLFRSSW